MYWQPKCPIHGLECSTLKQGWYECPICGPIAHWEIPGAPALAAVA